MIFHYHLRDRKTGKIFVKDESIEGVSKTDVRSTLKASAKRDIPRNARNYGYVPFHDWQIIWIEPAARL